MTDLYTPEANAAIAKLQALGFDYAEADMIYHGEKLGSALGAKVYTALEQMQRERETRWEYVHNAVVRTWSEMDMDFPLYPADARRLADGIVKTLNIVDGRHDG